MRVSGIDSNFFRYGTEAAARNKKHIAADKQPENLYEDSILDSVEISETQEQVTPTGAKNDYQDFTEQLENMRAQSNAMADSAKVRMKCLLIATRIMSGDEVPNTDHRYLAQNDPELYTRAVSLRTENPDPKKHKSIAEDGESENADEGASAEPVRTENVEIQETGSSEGSKSTQAE